MQVGTRGNINANVLIVGEAYVAEEQRQMMPFVGSSGAELDRLLTEAGIDPAACYYTNVVNEQPAGNEMTRFFWPTQEAKAKGLSSIRGLYPTLKAIDGLMRLEALIEQLRPKLIIGFGNYALWALTEGSFNVADGKGSAAGYKIPTGIANYRGSQLRHRTTGIPVLPTFHPAAVLRQWAWRPMVLHDLRVRVPKALNQDWDEPYRQYVVEPSFDEAMEVLGDLRMRAELSQRPLVLANDIETREGHIECVGIAWTKHHAICIPIMSNAEGKEQGYWTREEEVQVLTAMFELLRHPNVVVVGQNFAYDYQYYFYFYGQRPRYRHDTMLAQHVLFPGTEMGLNYISSMCCDWHCYWKADGKEASKKLDDKQRWIYNCRDCVVTLEAIEDLWRAIKHFGLERQYAIQMVRANASIDMMIRGTLVDERKRGEERMRHAEVCMEFAHALEYIMPENVWPVKKGRAPWYNSDRQIAEIFYDVLGVKEVYNKKTGNRTVDGDALKRIAAREPAFTDIVNKLLQWRSLQTFGEFLYMRLGPDGRMRCSFSPTTETFRYRSHESALGYGRNMQNIPSGVDD